MSWLRFAFPTILRRTVNVLGSGERVPPLRDLPSQTFWLRNRCFGTNPLIKNDVLLYRYIQNAAFSMRALEFIAEQLFSNTSVNSDWVSLIKFGEHPSVELSREPISWYVYNRILGHRNTQRYADRKNAPLIDEWTGGSNYLPALGKVHRLSNLGYHEQLAISVYFFSD